MSDHAPALRVTLHLTAVDRALLEGIDARRRAALAAYTQADRDFMAAGTGMAASRGLAADDVGTLTSEGLVIAVVAEEQRT